MIVITNGVEYIYLDDQHQIQKTTDISKAKTFTFQGKTSRQPRAFMLTTRKHSVSVTNAERKNVSRKPRE